MSADKLLIFGKGFQYSRDGTGNRLVFHLQGCDLRCPWCANPEGMSREPVLLAKGKRHSRMGRFSARISTAQNAVHVPIAPV